jgi:hypothetical protein
MYLTHFGYPVTEISSFYQAQLSRCFHLSMEAYSILRMLCSFWILDNEQVYKLVYPKNVKKQKVPI